jgi:hypothetical protein
LHPSASFKGPCKWLKEFRTKLLKLEGGQIGSMGIFVDGDSGPHIHALMLGRFPEGRTLKDIDEKIWGKMTCPPKTGPVFMLG